MLFKWKDEYSCQMEEIDNQHKKLFEIGSRIYDAISLDDRYDRYDEIMQIIDELRDYTIYHFKYEEELMEKLGYTELDSHMIEHSFFVKKLQRLERKDLEGQQKSALMEIITFVADWISSHILRTDAKYRPYLSSKI